MKNRFLQNAVRFPLSIALLLLFATFGFAAPVLYYDIANAPDDAWTLDPQYVDSSQTYLTATTLHTFNLNPPNSSDLEGPGDFLFSWWSWNPEAYGYIEFSVTAQAAVSPGSMQYTFFSGNWSSTDGPRTLFVKVSKDNFVSDIRTIRGDGSWNLERTDPRTADCPNDFVDDLSSLGTLEAGETLTIRFYTANPGSQTIPAGLWNKSPQDFNLTLDMTPLPPAPAVTVIAVDPIASEAGPSTGAFKISRTGGTDEPLTVRYVTRGTAISDQDYDALSGKAVIPAGASSVVVIVNPKADALQEDKEKVLLRLRSSADYELGTPGFAVVSIVNDN